MGPIFQELSGSQRCILVANLGNSSHTHYLFSDFSLTLVLLEVLDMRKRDVGYEVVD